MIITEVNKKIHVEGVEVLKDIPFGPLERQKLDIYYPPNKLEKHKTILYTYGGGLMKGDKESYQIRSALEMLKKDAIVVAINYRLAPEFSIFDALEDVAMAYEYIYHNAEDLNVDINDLIAWGESAGSLLAMIVSLSNASVRKSLGIFKDTPQFKIKAIVNQYGPTLLSDPTNFQSKQEIRKIQFKEDDGRLLQSLSNLSPLNLVDKNAPEMIMLYGTKDEIVDLKQAYLLQDKYHELGIKVKLHIIEGVGHDSRAMYKHVDKIIDDLTQ